MKKLFSIISLLLFLLPLNLMAQAIVKSIINNDFLAFEHELQKSKEAGLDINQAVNDDGELFNPLYLSVSLDRLKFASLLLSYPGLDINYQEPCLKKSALFRAAQMGNVAMVERLLQDERIDRTLKTNEVLKEIAGKTALDIAIEYALKFPQDTRFKEIVSLLRHYQKPLGVKAQANSEQHFISKRLAEVRMAFERNKHERVKVVRESLPLIFLSMRDLNEIFDPNSLKFISLGSEAAVYSMRLNAPLIPFNRGELVAIRILKGASFKNGQPQGHLFLEGLMIHGVLDARLNQRTPIVPALATIFHAPLMNREMAEYLDLNRPQEGKLFQYQVMEYCPFARDEGPSGRCERGLAMMALKTEPFLDEDWDGGENRLSSYAEHPRVYKLGEDYYKFTSALVPKLVDYGQWSECKARSMAKIILLKECCDFKVTKEEALKGGTTMYLINSIEVQASGL